MASERFYGVCSLPFEAARKVEELGSDHPSARLHGHSFLATARVLLEPIGALLDGCLDGVQDDLAKVVAPLDYSYLNDRLDSPTDENLARHVRSGLSKQEVYSVGIQSTRDQGVDLDADEFSHVWRKFRFEAAHRLPNVPPGHPCGRMHGHGFEVILHARQSAHDKAMRVDSDLLAEIWQPIKQILHGRCLNEIPGLANPTSEMIAAWIWERIEPRLAALSWVTVYETTSAGCHFDGSGYRIWKQQRFESAVDLAHPKGQSRLQGHSYIIRLHLAAPLDACMGWTVDYGDVKAAFQPLYEQLDHHALHDIPSLERPNIGGILRWIKSRVSSVLPQLDRLDLFERPTLGGTLCWGEKPLPVLPS